MEAIKKGMIDVNLDGGKNPVTTVEFEVFNMTKSQQ